MTPRPGSVRLVPALLASTLLLACAAPQGGGDPCAAAAAHLAACGASGPAPATAGRCDEAAAEAVLGLDCAALGGQLTDGKADNPFAAVACQLGFYAACPVPACPAATQPEDPAACGELIGAYDDCRLCAYYDCRERTAGCGPDAYLIAYVGRYCRRFAQVTEPRVSPAARAWLGRVRHCLVTWLEANVPYDAACEDIDRAGTDSHAACYVEAGFCNLSIADWAAIVHTIDLGDAPFRVMLATAQGCLSQWLGGAP